MNAGPLLEARRLVPEGAASRAALDLVLRPGEVVCLVGSDDSLRSRWLETLAAVTPPGAGELALETLDAWHMSRDEWRASRQRFGFIGEQTVLVSTLDGLTNVMLPALYHGRGSPGEVEQRALELIERFGLVDVCRRLPAYLRPGQRRRLLLARCLLLNPVALLVDEPFRLGDVGAWQETSRRANWLSQTLGVGLIVSTRNLWFVRKHSDRIVLVDEAETSVYEGFEDLGRAANDNAQVRALLEAGDAGPGA